MGEHVAGAERAVRLIFEGAQQRIQRDEEHSHLAHAAVIAFFAYFERLLTLALPFSRADLDQLDLTRFLNDGWGAKYKVVFDLQADKTAKKHFDALTQVSETLRNPRAHGHDKRGSTMSVFLEGVGSVPLTLADGGRRRQLRLGSFQEGTFEEVSKVFDEAEVFSRGPALGNAGRWFASGFDVPLYGDHLVAFRAGPTVFERFLEQTIESWENTINMDW